jgi:hypothetical protein
MTTYTEFTPSNTQVFTFQPTLDGTTYIITIPWSLFGQRYYVTCRTLGGNLVFSLPLIGSPAGINVQAATWEPNNATITVATPHEHKVGSIINLTLSGMAPDAYNGTFACKIINDTQFTFPLNSFPGKSPRSERCNTTSTLRQDISRHPHLFIARKIECLR